MPVDYSKWDDLAQQVSDSDEEPPVIFEENASSYLLTCIADTFSGLL